jgi:hypothetical protein
MKKIRPFIQAGIVGSVLVLACVSIKAQTALPAAYASWSLQTDNVGNPLGVQTLTGNSFGSPSLANTFSSASASSGASLTLGGDPSVSASSSASPGNLLGESLANASASIVYGFEIININGGTATSVPIVVTASGGANVVAPGIAEPAGVSAQAAWGPLEANGEGIVYAIASLGSAAVGSTTGLSAASFGGSQPGTASVGTAYGIDMSVSVIAEAGLSLTDTGSAYVDPTITIDPSFAQASDYEIVFAPGVSAVPEPSTIMSGFLLLLPFGASGLRMLRTNRAA